MGQPGMAISIIQNTIYIGADYQGLGLSRDLPQPYFNTVLTADQSIDCFRAALSLLKELGPNVPDDYSTYCIGYSLGGAVTLGIARRAELDPEVKRLLNLKKSYCGDGPYNMETMIDFFFSDTSKPLEYPISLPCAIRTALYASPLLNSSYTESDFFSDAFMESGLLELLDTKEYDTDQMNEILNNSGFNTTGSILSKEVLNPDSQIARQFYHGLKLVDLTSGWSPTTPIWLFHAKKDDTVPVACLEKLLDNMEGNPNISYYIKPSGNHHESGTDFYTSVLLGVRL
jgi:pimeloyl-ACP methyl ester carboxylesterase